jgi:hypothetical protein
MKIAFIPDPGCSSRYDNRVLKSHDRQLVWRTGDSNEEKKEKGR